MVIKHSTVVDVIDLYRGDYSSEYHVREIARLLNRSHTSIGQTLRRMESEGILKLKTMGRNKVYRLNKGSITVKTLIALAENTATIRLIEEDPFLKRMKEETSSMSMKASVVIFGSHAKGYADEESDIDVLCLGDVTPKEVRCLEQLGKTYGKKVSAKTASEKEFREGILEDDPLTKEIIKDHIVLSNQDVFLNIIWKVLT